MGRENKFNKLDGFLNRDVRLQLIIIGGSLSALLVGFQVLL